MNILDSALLALLRSSWQGGVLVLIVLSLQALLGQRLAPRWRHGLWLIVLVRLALPVSFEWQGSMFSLVPSLRVPLFSEKLDRATDLPARQSGFESLPVGPPISKDISSADEPREDLQLAGASVPLPTSDITPFANRESFSPSLPQSPWPWMKWVAFVWALGAVGFGVLIGLPAWHFSRRVARLHPLNDPRVDSILTACRNRMSLKRNLLVFETDAVASPALFGLWRPRLLLPPGLVNRFAVLQLQHIFLHELAHLRRRDLPLNGIMILLVVVHWFNPLVWLAMRRIRVDRELACDALALQYIDPKEARGYGETIISLVEDISQRPMVAGLVGMGEDPGALRARIRMIARFRKPGRWSALALVLLVGLGAVGLTDPNGKDVDPVRAESSSQNPESAGAGLITAAAVALEGANVSNGYKDNDGSSEPVCRIEVLDEKTGQPIEKAVVMVDTLGYIRVQPPQWIVETDARGMASIRHFALIQYKMMSVVVAHRDYAASRVQWHNSPGTLGTGVKGDLQVRLGRGVRLGGRLVDSEQKPIAGARVRLSSFGIPWPVPAGKPGLELPTISQMPGWSFQTVVETDGDGRWTFDRAPSPVVRASLEVLRPTGGRRWFSSAPNSGLSPSHPRVRLESLMSQAAVLEWKTGIDLDVRVSDASGMPVPDASVYLLVRNEDLDYTIRDRSLKDLVPEGKTDRSGSLSLWDQAWSEHTILVKATNYAVQAQVVPLRRGKVPVSIILRKALPLRLHVVDRSGNPISQVHVSFAGSSNLAAPAIPWSGFTDAQGRLEWMDAPREDFDLLFARGSRLVSFRMGGEQRERTIKILGPWENESISLSGQVVDSITGAPIQNYQILGLRREGYPNSGYQLLAKHDSGDFSFQLHRAQEATELDSDSASWNRYRLKVVAAGYEPLVTEEYHFTQGDQRLRFSLKPSSVPRHVRVLQPDGSPAVEAVMYRAQGRQAGFLPEFGSRYPSGSGSGFEERQSGADGRLELPIDVSETPLVVRHITGTKVITLGECHQHSSILLEAWGRIEVQWDLNQLDKTAVACSLESLIYIPGRLNAGGIQATSDKQGKVVFQHVTPGDYIIGRYGSSSSGILQDHHSVHVSAGETVRLNPGREAADVIGRLVPTPARGADAYSEPELVNLLVKKLPRLEWPERRTFASPDRYFKAMVEFLSTEAARDYFRQRRFYLIQCQPDGAFRIRGVEPGEYEIYSGVSRYATSRIFPWILQGLDEPEAIDRVTIPRVTGLRPDLPLDLGLIVSGRSTPVELSGVPLELEGRGQNGAPLSLASLRGKWVLLHFWSSWSDRSLERMAELKEVHAWSRQQPKFTLIGVNLDGEFSQSKETIQRLSLDWAQLHLTSEQRGAIVKQLSLAEIPRSLLLTPEGRPFLLDLPIGRSLEVARKVVEQPIIR
ncbi:MAG: redoxin domain-containing protein [Verrucomicrobiales bacterium]|nr:redoxin domain-containing protein [Verrucomicrobiales bacterium]